ncbi:hypothetical protein KIW84_074768 [Lathyrus oleraceus]|uniref:Chromatin-remodeling ATPase INO80 n=1 Tax=Pisum sativum TaxID=3888 RepID=A0A9D4VSB2_PEA|nr:hypothetical protein KIW84_074768 [Pisum sativum]
MLTVVEHYSAIVPWQLVAQKVEGCILHLRTMDFEILANSLDGVTMELVTFGLQIRLTSPRLLVIIPSRISPSAVKEPVWSRYMQFRDRASHVFPAKTHPIGAHCSDRNFYYKMIEELHDPWVKRMFVGFAHTSDCNGPRKPDGSHNLIQEIDSEHVCKPALQLTHNIFGSSPPMRNFDPAKLLTDSGKFQTLDILLKRLRAGNHRVLLFAQMTKMLNILEESLRACSNNLAAINTPATMSNDDL